MTGTASRRSIHRMCSNFDNLRPDSPPPESRVREYAGLLLSGTAGPLASLRVWPRQTAWILRHDETRADWRFECWRWSLVPFWSDTANPKMSTFNARSETVDRKPAYRDAWRRGQRCLIALTAWYESGRKLGRKGWVQIRPRAPAITFAGLWDKWTPRDGGAAHGSFTMLTTTAAPDLVKVHERMPVIIAEPWRDRWLDPATPSEHAQRLLHPVQDDFTVQPVS